MACNKKDCNSANCTCPKDCERHGKCCDCINHHRSMPLHPVVHCLRSMIEYTPVAKEEEN